MNTADIKNNTDGATSLKIVLSPLIEAYSKTIMQNTTIQVQEVLLELGKLNARLDVLEKLGSDKKKPAVRSDKKALETPTETVTTAAAATKETVAVVAEAGPAVKNFAVNKLVYFKEHFKTNADYRARFVDETMQGLMNAEPLIMAKTNDTQKFIAQATFVWNYIKEHKPDVSIAIGKEYDTAKVAHQAAIKPPQQVADPHTPVVVG